MNRPIRLLLLVLTAIVSTVISTIGVTTGARAQARDSIELIQQPGGVPYRCCYSFVVYNRQDSGSTISEFTIRIISGRATFVPGTGGSPADWTVFVGSDEKSVSWYGTSVASEIAPGTSKSGFAICAADTGIVKIVWETKTLDTLYTRDTVVAACRGIDCDEAFFRRVPSNSVCLFDVDVVAGNRRGMLVNDIRLYSATPGVTFASTAFRTPAGWTRTRISADSMQFFTTSAALDYGQFVQGFRFEARNVVDTFRVIYRTFNNGDLICFDTATLACTPLDVSDSVRITPLGSCCNDLRLSNLHEPASPLDRFSIRVLTPGVRMSGTPTAPTGWTRGAVPAAADSVFYTRTAEGLASGDTSLFRGLCFDNAAAASDTIRYRWQTYSAGIPVASGTVTRLCLRPLSRCDTAYARIDSTEGVTQRCISLYIGNRNSRAETITRVVARISNPGTARRILTATAPPGWQVMTLARDSVVFGGGDLEAGEDQKFELCVSTGDSTMRDPLTIAWLTESDVAPLCTGTLAVNVEIVRSFDSASVEESASQTPSFCCYTISFLNRNDALRTLDGFQLEVVNTNVLFGEASGVGDWTVVTSGFPSPQIGYTGGTVAPGDSSPRLSFCIDARNISERPAMIPIVFRTYANGSLVTTERLDLTCVGQPQEQCDTALVLSSEAGDATCSYGFALANLHTPASTINRIRFRIVEGDGLFAAASASGAAAGWQASTVLPDTVIFTGDSITSRDTVGTFNVTVGNAGTPTRTFEICSFNGELQSCCDIVEVACGAGGIAIPTEPSGFRLGEARPNPAASSASIPYELRRPASVVLVLRDEHGRVVARVAEGARSVGEHTIALDASAFASGVYYYTLEAGAERWTKRMVVVR
jgi:hypothetical protein